MTSPRLLMAYAALDAAIDATRTPADRDDLTTALLGIAASAYRGDVREGSLSRDEARTLLVEAALDAFDRVDAIASADEAQSAPGGSA